MRSLHRLLSKNEEGVAAIEFALIAPVLLTIVLGVFQFGLVMNQYLMLTNAAAKGALTLALSRGSATPFSSTTQAVGNAAPSLVQSNITVTVTINGAACASDAACSSGLVAGQSASVTAAYPCNLTVMGVNYAPSGCTLTARSAMMVQ